jgi:crotonobetainyl-CoA:carnitine CoA-transferase CaiB-like acyl-CoA transferase
MALVTAGSAAPLDGVIVVDLTRQLPGPYCTRLLADLGARVIKIEDPRGGDPARSMAPLQDGVGAYFRLLNHGKESVALDLKNAAARRALHAILARADVCVEGFKPDTARALGVDGASLRGQYPALVHCSISGYGQAGPYSDAAGHDLNYQALAGLVGLRGAPRAPDLLVADVTAGWKAALGIVAALAGRQRSGAGASLDVALHDAAAAWLPIAAPEVMSAEARGTLPVTGHHACYNVYEAADGNWLALGALEVKFWERFCRQLGREAWIPLQYAEEPRQSQLVAEVRALIKTKSRDAWLREFEGVDCCLSHVSTPAEVWSDPHVVARGLAQAWQQRPVPALGADTERVLREMGVQSAW